MSKAKTPATPADMSVDQLISSGLLHPGLFAEPEPPPAPPAAETSFTDDIARAGKHGVQVTLPRMVGQAAQFFGAKELGDGLVKGADARESADNAESAYGKSLDSPWSVRGNVYEAVDNAIPSLAPGAAGAVIGAGIGSVVPGVGTAVGALLGYGLGSLASLPMFYGSQGQTSYEKVKKAQLEAGATPEQAESHARTAGHQAGTIEATFELAQDIIPFGKLFKPFAKPAGKAAGTLVKDTFFPTVTQGVKSTGKVAAGEVTTEMAQQAGEAQVEGNHGAGPGATWDDTASVIMPTLLMSLIPGLAGAASKHVQVNATRQALESPKTDADTRAKIAAGAAAAISKTDQKTARNFSLYAAKQIADGKPIKFDGDAFYAGAAEQARAAAGQAPATPVDPAVAAAAAKAQEPNSPLSKAAVAGNAAQPQRGASDPAARMAELESISKGRPAQTTTDAGGNQVEIPAEPGRFFTEEEQKEYQSLKAARDATPGAAQDPIAAKVAGIQEQVRSGGLMDSLRASDSPVDPKAFLNDLAVASSPSTQANLREQALTRLEFAMGWAGHNLVEPPSPGLDQLPGLVGGDAPTGARPTVPQLRAGVDREKALQDQRAGAPTEFDRSSADAQMALNRERTMRGPGPGLGMTVPNSGTAPITATEQQGLEAAALAGNDTARKAEDAPRQAVIDKAMRSIDLRRGVASPAEAQILAEAGLGKPYDRIDETLAPALTADQKLTQATGIALDKAPRAKEAKDTDSAEQAKEQQDRSDSRMERLAQDKRTAQARKDEANAALAEPTAPPAADAVISALKAIPALRTAEQRLTVTRARTAFTAEQMRILGDAANIPANLSATDKLELEKLRADATKSYERQAETTPGAASPASEQTVAATRNSLPRVVAPAGEGPAFLRKRRAQFDQLTGIGFETVERMKDGKYVLRDAKSGKEIMLDGAADAQLARSAIKARVDAGAHKAAASPLNDKTEPTGPQIDAGNYEKGHIANLNGVTLKIENPRGSMRRSKPGAAKKWETKMVHHYGDVLGTKGADGDAVDVFVGPRPDSSKIFVIDQRNADGSFDEHKVMMGFTSEAGARAGYLANYAKGWKGLGAITEMTPAEFRAWAFSDASQKAASEAGNNKGSEDGRRAVRAEGLAPVDGAEAGDGGAGRSRQPRPGAVAVGQPADERDAVAGGGGPTAGREGGGAGGAGLVDSRLPGAGRDGELDAGERIGRVISPGRREITVRDDGKPTTFTLLDDPSGGQKNRRHGARINAAQAALLRRMAGALGVEVEFFDSDGKGGDGFVDDAQFPGVIFLASGSGINPLAVFGHEFWHRLKKSGPKGRAAADAVERILRERGVDLAGASMAYDKGEFASKTDKTVAQKEAFYLEELSSDLMGDNFADPAFWGEVMDLIASDHGAAAPGIIAHLVASWNAMAQAVSSAFGRSGAFGNAKFVGDIEAVRAVMRDAMAEYVKGAGLRPTEMQAEVLKAQQGLKKSASRVTKTAERDYTADRGQVDGRGLGDTARGGARENRAGDGSPPSYGRAQPGSVSAVGIHFSKSKQGHLNSAFYGSGLKGLERERLAGAENADIRPRIFFYVDKGTGVRAEHGVGSQAHSVKLDNVYDAYADPRGIVKANPGANNWERAILRAGFDGYLAMDPKSPQGFAVLVGKQHSSVPVRPDGVLEPAGSPLAAQPGTLKKSLLSRELAEIDLSNIPGATLKSGNLVIPAGQVGAANAELERIGSGTRFGDIAKSADRQIESPEFRRWFGQSKVVDADGKPLVVYHGGQKLTAWNRKGDDTQVYGGHADAVKRTYGSSLSDAERDALDNPVHFFTDNLDVAEGYGDQGDNYEVRQEYLRMERPLDLRADVVGDSAVESALEELLGTDDVPSGYRQISQALRWSWSDVGKRVKALGHDGIILYDTDVRDRGRHTSYAVFEPTQIKSATGNSGEFDGADPDIRKSPKRDLFPGEFADDDSFVEREVVVDSRGGKQKQKLGNLNADGARVASTRQGLQKFWDWFGDSELVDESGRPLVLYHGTRFDVDRFETMRATKNTGLFGAEYDARRAGFFLTADREIAGMFADADGGNVMQLYARMESPADFRRGLSERLEADLEAAGFNTRAIGNTQYDWEMFDEEYGGPELVAALKKAGYDGAIITDQAPEEGGRNFVSYVAFDAEQVKSATGNRGTFNPGEADIRKSEGRDYKLDIERDERATGKSARMSTEEIDAVTRDAQLLGLDDAQTKALIADARDTKNRFPRAEGWAPLEATGARLELDEHGQPKPDSIKLKFKKIAYAFNVPPGSKRAPPKRDEAWARKVASKFEGLIEDIFARANAGDKNAQTIIGHQTWYRSVAEVLRREYGGFGDLLADLLGATSPNTPVNTNWKFSLQAMRKFLNGDYNSELKALQDYMAAGKPLHKFPNYNKVRQASGMLYGINSDKAMLAMLDLWRIIEPDTAPKARNFALNLIGQSNMATIDVWAARMLRRAANMVRGADMPRVPPPAEQGVTGKWNAGASDVTGAFGFGAWVLDHVSKSLAAKGIHVSPPDLQAVAWFAEKELWGQKGWTTKTGEGGSFEENIEATPVDRYLAGWSIQQGEKVPEDHEMSLAQARVMSILSGDDSVLAARAMPTHGLYADTLERSFDTEWTARRGEHDPSMAMAEIARIAGENDQWDIFVSKVLGPKDLSPNARPGVEIYFKTKRALDEAMPVLEAFTSRGQDGFTMVVDPRSKKPGEYIGVRLQYVPEISARWDNEARARLLEDGGLEAALEDKTEQLADIVRDVERMDGVAHSAVVMYDTVVVGKESYDEFIGSIAANADHEARGEAWFGRPARQALEGAVARYAGEQRQDDAGRVHDAGGEVPDWFEHAPAEDILRSAGRDRGRRDQGRGLAPLAGAPAVRGATGPDARLVQVAERYAATRGISLRRQAEYARVDERRAARIAAAYDAMPHAPQDRAVKAAYASLIRQTRDQYDALVDAGYEFTFFDAASDPYGGNPWNAMRDLRANQHMAVYGTYDGYGTEGVTQGAVEGNPMLADTGLRWPDQAGVEHPVLANDLFRAVHDAFGHGLEGAGFRAQGEENAWQAHVRLFTGPAVGAITSETRGQNSWLNYGPHGEKNRTARVEDTVFADQKTGLMPEWTWEEGVVGSSARSGAQTDAPAPKADANISKSAARQTETPEFKRWFGDSKVVDADGGPMVVYHGTRETFNEFRVGDEGALGGGIYFTSKIDEAAVYGEPGAYYVRIERPIPPDELDAVLEAAEEEGWLDDEIREEIEGRGYDGIISPAGDETLVVAYDPAQVKSATRNSGAFGTSSDVTKSNERVWYSELQSAITRVPERLSTMSAPQWAQWLKANAGKLGVKQDEITWSGIEDYLKLRGKDKITRDELAAWVGENGVKVEETVLGAPDYSEVEAWWGDEGGANEETPFDELTEQEKADAAERYAEEVGQYSESNQTPRYAKYQLPGGTNYREVLLTLPAKSVHDGAWRVRYADGVFSGRFNDKSAAAEAAAENVGATVVPSTKSADTYESSHWKQPNVLAHIRLSDRTDTDGKRVLFVDEIQSDWGQTGKKRGFSVKDATPLTAEEGGELDRLYDMRDRRTQEQTARMHALNDRLNASGGKPGIPLAPFVTKTNDWLGLALKRIIKLGVDGGYDKVAFVTGEQSAERYDLRKQIDAVDYRRVDVGSGDEIDLHLIKGGDIIQTVAVREGELEDHVGKDLAQKISAGEGELQKARNGGWAMTRLEGLDLAVGGEGMKTFYEQIVPQEAAKLLKKLGGGGLRDVRVSGAPLEHTADALGFDTSPIQVVGWGAGNFVVTRPHTEIMRGEGRFWTGSGWSTDDGESRVFGSRAAAEASVGGTTQPGFDITPDMAERAGRGMPLFSRYRSDPELEKWADDALSGRAKGERFAAVAPALPHPAWLMAGLDSRRPVTVDTRLISHIKQAEHTEITAGMIGRLAELMANPRAMIRNESIDEAGRKVTRYQALVDARDDQGRPILVAVRPSQEGVRGHSIDVYDVRTMFGRNDSMVYMIDQLRHGNVVWMADKEATALQEFMGRGTIPHGGPKPGSRPSSAMTGSIVPGDAATKIYPGKGWAKAGNRITIPNSARNRAAGVQFSRDRQVETPAFKAWFGDSKVVDAEGAPLRVFSGTSKDADFKSFKIPKSGAWFTADAKIASQYAFDNDSKGTPYNPDTRRWDEVNTSARVIPAYLQIENPYTLSEAETERLHKASNYKVEQGRVFNAARAKGYDGIDFGDGTWVVLKDPTQIKSAVGNDGGFDPGKKDITKSARRQLGSAAFKSWFGKSKVVDAKGEPRVVYHGTTNEFASFERSRSNVESDWGAGFYFSSEPADVSANYAGEGPDLTGRIELLAERIANEEDIEQDEAVERARQQLSEGKPHVLPVYLSLQNPLELGGQRRAYWDAEWDEDDAPHGKAHEFVDALREAASGFGDIDIERVLGDLDESFGAEGGYADEMIAAALKSEGLTYATDRAGYMASVEVIRQTLAGMGYDGIIDATVDKRFGSQSGRHTPLAGMKPDTVHFIAFEPEQIKSAIGNSGDFDARDADITKSRARWTDDRIDNLMSRYAYTMDDTRTKAYAAWVKPDDFLAATTPADNVERLEAERRPLDIEELSNQDQPIMLIGDLDNGKNFKTRGHEGRHRMMALRDAGVRSVPVVFDLGGGVSNREPLTSHWATPQSWSGGPKAQKGFLTGSLVPISYKYLPELKKRFGRDEEMDTLLRNAKMEPEVVFSRARDEQTDTRAFKRWFGASVVTEDGKAGGVPLVVYHGTTADFTAFDKAKLGKNTNHSTAQLGFFFSADPKVTDMFNEKLDMTVWPYKLGHMDGSNTMPVYLSIKNPKVLTADYFRLMAKAGGHTNGPANAKMVTADVKALRDPSLLQRMFGDTYDGVLIKGDPALADTMGGNEWAADTWVAFHPEQIKSAIGNNGAFDPADADITRSADRLVPEDDGGGPVYNFSSPVGGIKTFKVIPKRGGNIEILDLEVDRKREGVGRKAVDDFLSWAARNRFNKVRADSVEQAIPFWLSMGFVDTGRKDGRLHTLIADLRDIAKSAERAFDTPGASKFDDAVYTLQDKHVDTKRVVEAVKAAGGALRDDLDVYLQEELFHGRAAKRTEDFVHMELEPLVEAMKADGLTIAELDEFLHARHAREANEVIARRNPAIQDGGSGLTNQDAAAYFAELPSEKRAALETAAAKVDAMLHGTRAMMVDYELESAEKVQGWAEMFDHYVPLMRDDEGGHTGGGTGQGFSIKGKEVRSRTGSKRKVVDILANIAMQRERTIVRGEKNRVAQALVGLAKANPNKDFWKVDTVPTSQVFNAATGQVEEHADNMFKQRDNVVVAKVAYPGGIHEHAVIFNENDERALRMSMALKNLDAAQLEGILGASAKVTRYLASVNTQYNPVFGVVNLIRDVQEAMVTLSGTELAGKQKEVARHTMSALRGVYGDLRAMRKGNEATSEWAHLWEEFQHAGGQTGFRQLFVTSADRAKAIENALDPTAWMDSKLGRIFTVGGTLKVPMAQAQRGAKWIFDWLSDYNEAMENCVRLSAYKSALDAGMSRERAASLAKNLTVNFNRKGQAGQQAGALYAFFNASVQGTARIGRALFDMDPGKPKTIHLSPVGKKVVYGGMLLGVMQALAMAAAGFGDDDPPEFSRNNNLIIPLGGGKYATIPMPMGLRLLPSLGRTTTEWALSGFKDPTKRALSLVSLFADAFNPLGNAGLSMQTLAPTALDPLVALTENKDFAGRPIARESRNKATPGYTLARDTSSSVGKLTAEAINWLSGGTKYTAGVVSPTPDQIDYLIAQITGGVGRELTKGEQTVRSTFSGETLPLYKVPLVGRLVGDAKSQSSESTNFRANTEHLNELETEIKGLRADGKFADANKVRLGNPEAYLITQANHAELQIQKLRKKKSELIKAGAPREDVKAIEEKITARMAALNRAVEALAPR